EDEGVLVTAAQRLERAAAVHIREIIDEPPEPHGHEGCESDGVRGPRPDAEPHVVRRDPDPPRLARSGHATRSDDRFTGLDVEPARAPSDVAPEGEVRDDVPFGVRAGDRGVLEID